MERVGTVSGTQIIAPIGSFAESLTISGSPYKLE